MSGYYYNARPEEEEDDDTPQQQHPMQAFAPQYRQSFSPYTAAMQQQTFPAYTMNVGTMPQPPQQRFSIDPQHILRSQYQYTTSVSAGPQQSQPFQPQQQPQQPWQMAQQPQQMPQQPMYNIAGYPQSTDFVNNNFTQTSPPMFQQPFSGPPPGYLSPPIAGPSRPRLQRAASVASHASSSVSYNTDNSRSASPNALEMARWGTRNRDGTWTCSYRGCTSRATFSRGCDLRKHYKRHTKSLFCRYDGCPQATSGGFSSKKDRLRHEQKHNPQVRCEFEECGRLFSRVDNMKDHVRRVHLRNSTR